MKNKKIIELIAFGIFMIFLWQLIFWIGIDMLGIWKKYSMPSPIGVGRRLISMIADKTILLALRNSLLRGIVGYLISMIIGFLMGIIMNRFEFLHRNLRPFVMGVQTLPSVCWVPFSILWFGLTESAILFVVIMGSAFSIAVAVEGALNNVLSIYKKAALTMGATKKQLYFKVIVPASIPEIISGLKQGWSFAWRALMSGEVMTTCIGLGQTLITGRDLADINQVMLVMIVIILVGMFIDKLVFVNIEKYIYTNRGM